MIEERIYKLIAATWIMGIAVMLTACNFDNFMSAANRFNFTATDENGMISKVDQSDWYPGAMPGKNSRHVLRDRAEKITPAIGPAYPNPATSTGQVQIPFENFSRHDVQVQVWGPNGLLKILHQGESYFWHQNFILEWDLRDQDGRPVPPGIYTIVLRQYGWIISRGDVVVKLQ